MLKSYEAVYENGHLKWLNEKPELDSARVIVTVLSGAGTRKPMRAPPASLAGQVEIRGDIVSPIVDDEDWECLK